MKTASAPKVTAIALLVFLGSVGLSMAQAPTCPEVDPAAFNSWADIAAWRRENAACDDGESSETVTWLVTGKLAAGAEGFSSLSKFLKQAPDLRSFFMFHVGGSADPRHSRQVRAIASQSCPADSKILCRAVLRALRSNGRTADETIRRDLSMGDYQ